MLAEIAIENLGVIPQATLELSDGLTVLTGETGAGKTMLVTGLRLLIGARADAHRVRSGTTQAAVEGRFVLDGIEPSVADDARSIVEAAGGRADENGEYIATRVVNATGRSKAHLGGRSVPASVLGDFAAELLTIHGQNDQLRLLSSDQQLAALDRMNPKIGQLLQHFQQTYDAWRSLDRDLTHRTKRRRELAQEVDRLQFAINEITEINPQPGEDQELIVAIRRLQDVDELREQAVGALSAIDGAAALYDDMTVEDEMVGASDLLGRALNSLKDSADPALTDAYTQLEAMTTQLSEVSAQLGAYLSALPADPEELEQLLLRQQSLKTLTRKYAPDIDGVLEWLAKAEEKLLSIDSSPEALEHLTHQVQQAEKTMMTAAHALSKARRSAAKQLSKDVSVELQGLSMPKAVFSAAVSTVEPTRFGIDEVQFLLAPNSRTEPRPLASSASGGELSRVMLALEVILSAGSAGTTLVFDEIDAGVGGIAAVEIGRRLARLARRNQVIVVTHLPQVAAYASTHLHVSKDVNEETVRSGVEVLDDNRRVEELARMLAGLEDTDTGRAHARELLEKAQAEIANY